MEFLKVRRLWIIRSMVVILILNTPLALHAKAPFCGFVFAKTPFHSPHFVEILQGKYGGRRAQWESGIETLLQLRKDNRLKEMAQLMLDANSASWFTRKINTLFFWRVNEILTTLDYVRRTELMDLGAKTSWGELSLTHRRAILLGSFKTWWWEVRGTPANGRIKFFDLSYLLAKAVQGHWTDSALRTRLHELLGGVSDVGFFSSLIRNFATEVSILRQLEDGPASVGKVEKLLQDRIQYLDFARKQAQANRFVNKVTEVQLLRAAVLKEMLIQGRPLKKSELKEVAESLGLPDSLLREIRIGQIGLNSLPFNLGAVVETILTTGLIYIVVLLIHSMSEDRLKMSPWNEVDPLKPAFEEFR